MSLGIFSYDLMALINSLSDFIEASEEIDVDPADIDASLDKMTEVLQNTTGANSIIADALMATALENVVTTIISSTENVKNETVTPKPPTPLPIVRVPSVTLDAATKKELEQMIKSLQTSVIHNYKSTDIIDESVSLKNVANFPRRNIREDSEKKPDTIQDEKKRDEKKLLLLREELKRAMMRNNSDV